METAVTSAVSAAESPAAAGGTIDDRHLDAGANTPAYLTKWALGAGTNAESFSGNSSGSYTTGDRRREEQSSRRFFNSAIVYDHAEFKARAPQFEKTPVRDGCRDCFRGAWHRGERRDLYAVQPGAVAQCAGARAGYARQPQRSRPQARQPIQQPAWR